MREASRTEAWRDYVSRALQAVPQQRYMGRTWAEAMRQAPAAITQDEAREVARRVAERAGLTITDRGGGDDEPA